MGRELQVGGPGGQREKRAADRRVGVDEMGSLCQAERLGRDSGSGAKGPPLAQE